VKLTKCQNEHHHGGVFDTWTKWAKPQAKWAQGSAGRPNSLADRPGFELARPRTWLTHLYVGSQGRIHGLKAVEAGRPFAPSRPCQVGGDSPYPYISPPTAEESTTHTTCSSPPVKVWFGSSSTCEALSEVESRVEHSLELQK
jgi:hypothetical protein